MPFHDQPRRSLFHAAGGARFGAVFGIEAVALDRITGQSSDDKKWGSQWAEPNNVTAIGSQGARIPAWAEGSTPPACAGWAQLATVVDFPPSAYLDRLIQPVVSLNS